MARPTKEGLDYFPHDTDAYNDEKIEALRMKHGADGYVFYFFHLERIYRSPNAEIVSDAETRQIFSRKLEITEQKYAEILETCLKYHCFDLQKYRESGILTSNGIKKRAICVYNKRLRMKELYKNRIVSAAETRAESTQSKVKESKVKESKVKESKVKIFTPPTLDEIKNYISQKNYRVDALTFYDYFNEGNWIDSKGNKVKNWKQKLITWENHNGQTRRSKRLDCEKGTSEGKYADLPCEIIDNTNNT